jgi:37-kD nucleoid-associated bacterial protein
VTNPLKAAVDIGFLDVQLVIVHEVPVHDDGMSPLLSEVESDLTPDVQGYFRDKIKGSLRETAYPVVFDPDARSPVPDLVRTHLSSDGDNFVLMSQEAARHLFGVQTRRNPGGLLVVVSGQLGAAPCLAILKLEKEQGVRLREETRDGKRTFNLQHLRDLVLSERARVFKVGLFLPDRDSPDGVAGRVCDTQRGRLSDVAVARFFLVDYLGCRLQRDPQVTTQEFFSTAEQFINERVSDPEKQAKYDAALITVMGSAQPIFSPDDFIRDHLEGDDRRAFRAHLREHEMAARPFPKDTTLIKSALRRVRMAFRGGASVSYPPEALNETVKVITLGENRAKVEIEDTVSKLSGGNH